MSSLPSEAEARKILDDERSGQAVMEDFLEGEVPLVEYDSDADSEDDGDALAQLPRATDPAESEPVEMEAESTTTTEAAGPAPTVTDYTAQADVLLELLSTRYRRTADRARVIEALTASGGAYLAAAHWLDTQGHLRSVS